ncbi:MAG: hypothetical protein KO318_10680 [Methanobacterium sp.]|jgi:hypothetical protein|uniref:hypothetical protein n=1 Tax=Methanobacterium sp. TaxID=2164 RepID=UPI00258312ED|nr:hypothetical protein [Methanobacterium sp.]MCC7560872.1 hypothetical protein [Methanobacterium sp.]
MSTSGFFGTSNTKKLIGMGHMEKFRMLWVSICLFIAVYGFISGYLHPFEAYGTDNGFSYNSDYLSFSHNFLHDFVHINKLDPSYNSSYNYSYIVSARFINGDQIVVYRPIDTNLSAYEEALKLEPKNIGNHSADYTVDTIQIANSTGYKIDSLNYYSGFNEGEFVSESIDIVFVKNGKLYQISFFSSEKDHLNQNQANMDKIVNSFTVY